MADDSSDDDYMTMAVPEVSTKAGTSSLARASQRRKEGEIRGAQKSKRELEQERLQRLEKGLRTNLDRADEDDWAGEQKAKSKGAAMLAKLGYKGGPLGRAAAAEATPVDGASTSATASASERTDTSSTKAAQDHRLVDPIRVQVKNNKFGIGVADEEEPGMKRARKALDDEEARIKRLRGEMGDYRERRTQEADERRLDGQWHGAMRVLETLVEQDRERQDHGGEADALKEDVPLVLKPLMREREEVEQLKRVKASKDSLHHRREDDDGDEDDKVAMGEALEDLPEIAGDQNEDDDEDLEVEEYIALPAADRLDKTVRYLRDKYWYCFWCKAKYDHADMEGCPGTTEADHD